MGPRFESHHANRSATLSRLATSTGWHLISLPDQESKAACSADRRLPAMTTSQPAAANSQAIPQPIPVAPPVTNTFFSKVEFMPQPLVLVEISAKTGKINIVEVDSDGSALATGRESEII